MFEFENNYLLLWVDETIYLMYSDWLRPVTSEEYREGNELLLSQLHERSVENWIADSSKLGDISQEDEQWTFQRFLPALASSSLIKVARIGGEDTGSHAKFEQFVKRAEPVYIGNIQVRQFVTYKDAADWVGEIPV